jgi:glycosyltransferase involved in cell wall biosynthesis
MKIALFFSFRQSLARWRHRFLLERDTALYRRLQELGHEVCFVTYGPSEQEREIGADVGIPAFGRPDVLPEGLYKWAIPFVHRAALSEVDVIKSHQISGSRYAIWAKRRLRSRFIARCGFLRLEYQKWRQASRRKLRATHAEERQAFRNADAICVPSAMEAQYVRDHYAVSYDRVHVCPNWIDTDAFRPAEARADDGVFRVCFVARYVKGKQPLMVVRAVRNLPGVELLMIGGGRLMSAVQAEMERTGVAGRILPRVPNAELPGHLVRCDAYVLPTLFEGGSPKTLLEAMSCGLPVIATHCFGVDQAFEHGVHGLKIDPKESALRDAILALRDDAALRGELGRRAREHAVDHFSLERALERESAVLESLA